MTLWRFFWPPDFVHAAPNGSSRADGGREALAEAELGPVRIREERREALRRERQHELDADLTCAVGSLVETYRCVFIPNQLSKLFVTASGGINKYQ